VTIFLNVRAPELAVGALGDEVKFRDNPPLRVMLAELMERGVTVIVCPHCMEAMDITLEQFAKGISTATGESLFGALKPNTAVFSY
jgi:intracellular sulfur oxidation DsrE/DsrF family protein